MLFTLKKKNDNFFSHQLSWQSFYWFSFEFIINVTFLLTTNHPAGKHMSNYLSNSVCL